MTIEDESKRIRRRIPRLRSGQKRRFTPELRAQILDWVDRAKAAGFREADCSRLLRLPAPQFNAWRPKREPPPMKLPMDWLVEPISRDLVPIAIPPGIELTAGVVVVAASGHRVEGLNLEQAYALLREFS